MGRAELAHSINSVEKLKLKNSARACVRVCVHVHMCVCVWLELGVPVLVVAWNAVSFNYEKN